MVRSPHPASASFLPFLTSFYRGYLYATVAIYGFSLIMRFGLIFLRHGQSIPRGTLIALPSDAVRLTIPLPAHHLWSAGQHYFLNFISASPFESHPYTISNTPHLHSKSDADARERTMVVVLRINPKVGLGPKLLGLAESGRSTVVLLDGPYGGLGNARIGRYETVLLLAGGAGASFITALLEEVCEGIAKDESGVVTSRVDLIWAVRDEGALSGFLSFAAPSRVDAVLSEQKQRCGSRSRFLPVWPSFLKAPSMSTSSSRGLETKSFPARRARVNRPPPT